MKKIIYFISVLVTGLFISACGEGTVEIDSSKYQQKIVVEAYLSPENPVENIKISRNFPLNTPIDASNVYLTDAAVSITDMETNREYQLVFNPSTYSYRYPGNDLHIGYSKTYRLSVTAKIDNKRLTAKSVTTTPNKGFSINKSLSVSGEVKYREKDEFGEVKKLKLVFNPSPGTDFYAVGLVAVDASLNKFIFDNPYFKFDTNEVIKDFEHFKYEYNWLQNVKGDVQNQIQDINWLDTWFYGNYRVVMYAGDRNFKDYFITINQLQEMDGNYHEPKMYFEGDGIGIFGSFIADTVTFNLVK